MARILIIDDHESFRSSMQDLLEAAGHSVTTAADGVAGVEEFLKKPFDLVISDLFMPNKDGLETIGDILRIAPATPIISTTGYEVSPDGASGDTIAAQYLHAAREFGATHTLVKPFDPEKLLALVAECLEEKALASRIR
jgi:CheY-like chemotaxis protein